MMEGRIRDDERVRQQCWEGASAMLGRRVRGWKGASGAGESEDETHQKGVFDGGVRERKAS